MTSWFAGSLRAVLLAASGVLLTGFAFFFDPTRPQCLVDILWLGGLAAWLCGMWLGCARPGIASPEWWRAAGDRAAFVHAGDPRVDVRPLIAILVVFAAVWLPFHDDWRWAGTGDSGAWLGPALDIRRDGRLSQNLLSVRGVDDNFTYLHSLVWNLPMLFFEPTLFWHRVGKLLASACALAAIYAFFSLAAGRTAAIATTIATATSSVWLYFSYVSYGHIDSHLFGYVTLLAGLWTLRAPERDERWATCGAVTGLALFFTQTAWTDVSLVALGLGTWALVTRRRRGFGIYVVSSVAAGLPIFLQVGALVALNADQAAPSGDAGYVAHIFWRILQQPWWSPHGDTGVSGAFLQPPLRELYPPGLALAILASHPWLRQRLRIPAIAPLALAALAWEAMLMALTNNAYTEPSVKRSYHALPLQIFLSLIPVLVAHAHLRRIATRPAALLPALVLIAYAATNLDAITRPTPLTYGWNFQDGLIEAHQRFPKRRLVFFTTRADAAEWIGPGSLLDRLYGLSPRLRIVPHMEATRLELAARSGAVVCHEDAFGADAFARMRRQAKVDLHPIDLRNSAELHCFLPGHGS